METLCAWPLCFLGDMGATRRLRKAQADCLRKPTQRQLCGVPLQPTRKVCSKKTTAEVEVRSRIQQFLKFRFSKGTSAELKLRSTLQQSESLVIFFKQKKLTLRKNRSCQRLHRNWRLCYCRIFCWKTPCRQCLRNSKWEISPSLAEVYVPAAAIPYRDQVFGQ